jgi:ketosteroid isomerase-like protein
VTTTPVPASPVPASPVPASPVPASPVPASPVPASTPAGVARAFADALGRRDVAAALALVDPHATVTVHPLGLRDAGPDALRAALADLVRGLPDLLVTVSRVIATGDVVTVELTLGGTQAAGYAGTINTEKHVDLDQAWRLAVTGGLIIGVTAYWCQAQLYRRLGVRRYDQIAIA